jgi:hypothetical protein
MGSDLSDAAREKGSDMSALDDVVANTPAPSFSLTIPHCRRAA